MIRRKWAFFCLPPSCCIWGFWYYVWGIRLTLSSGTRREGGLGWEQFHIVFLWEQTSYNIKGEVHSGHLDHYHFLVFHILSHPSKSVLYFQISECSFHYSKRIWWLPIVCTINSKFPRLTFMNPYQAYLITHEVQLPLREAGVHSSLNVPQQFQSWWFRPLYYFPLTMCLYSFPLMQKVQACSHPHYPMLDLSETTWALAVFFLFFFSIMSNKVWWFLEWLSWKKAKYKGLMYMDCTFQKQFV